MIRYLILILLASATAARGDCGSWRLVLNSTGAWVSQRDDSWCVKRGTETYSLDEFVKSGKLCKWKRYHQWKVWVIREPNDPERSVAVMECFLCGKERERRVKKEMGEWEWWEP